MGSQVRKKDFVSLGNQEKRSEETQGRKAKHN